jgi:hypothetical protein
MNRQTFNSKHFSEQFPPEFRLVLACLRDEPDMVSTLSATFGAEKDWVRFLQTARRHRVEGSLAAWARKNPDHFPPAVREALSRRELQIVQKNLLLKGTLQRLTTVFGHANIPMLAIKGPALALQFYPANEIRQSRDLDILVSPESAKEAVQVLVQEGFTYGTSGEERGFTRHYNTYHMLYPHIGLRDPKTNVRIELHWRLFTFPELEFTDFAGLWGRRTQVNNTAQPVNTLSAEDHFRFVCMHGLLHGWYQLSWIRDVAIIMNQHPDWSEIHESMQQQVTAPLLFQAIDFAGYFFNLQKPPEFLNESSDRKFIMQANAFSLLALKSAGQEELTGIRLRLTRAFFFLRIQRMVGSTPLNYLFYLVKKALLRIRCSSVFNS